MVDLGNLADAEPSGTRERILVAAAGLLSQGGREAVTTRAVSSAAGVQAPTIYRLFGDKRGLLDALATHGLATYLLGKVNLPPGQDPVDDLRAGWDLHVDFGLANPALYALMFGDPRPGDPAEAARAALEVLARLIHRIALAGRLAVPEQQATQLVHAAGSGTTLALIGQSDTDRDLSVSLAAREAVVAAITTDEPVAPASGGAAAAAVALRASLPAASSLSGAEQALLGEWLDRIAADRT